MNTKLIKILNEELRLLAEVRKQYGAWIDANGKVIPVTNEDHLNTLHDLFGDKKPDVLEQGWIRIVYEEDTINASWRYKKPTSKAKISLLDEMIGFEGFLFDVSENKKLIDSLTSFDNRKAKAFVKRN